MDSVIPEKHHAIKMRYKSQLLPLQKLVQLMLSLLGLGLFLSSPLWLSSSLSMLKDVGGIAFSPKGLFVVCNVIIMALFGESKLCKSTVQSDIYQEHVNRNRSNQKLYGSKDYNEEENKNERRRRKLLVEEDEEEEIGGKRLDELNKRVEEFIARVNKQRKLEAIVDKLHV